MARLETAGAEPRVAIAVVELAGLGIRERLVGLGHLAEAELGIRLTGDVRMELPRELAESLLDRLLVGGLRDAEQVVVVAFGGGHGAHIVPAAVALAPSSRRMTRFARSSASGREPGGLERRPHGSRALSDSVRPERPRLPDRASGYARSRNSSSNAIRRRRRPRQNATTRRPRSERPRGPCRSPSARGRAG